MARARETENWSRAVDKAIAKIGKMAEEKPKKFMEKLDEEAKSIISDWYADYEPTYYGMMRQMRLRKAYRIEQDGAEVSVSFDASYLSGLGFHQNENIVYNNVFVLGYHGGSGEKADKSNIRWRTPYPSKVNKLKGLSPYSSWSEREVVQTKPSPYDALKEKSEVLMDEYIKDFVDEFEDRVMRPLRRSYGGLTRR